MIRFFKNMSRKQIIILSIVGVFFIIGLIPKLVRFIETALRAREAAYTAIVETPQITNGEDTLELSGELKPFLYTKLYSRIDGLVKERYVELGDKVKKGQLLAEIETPDLDAETASAKSALISAEKREMETKYQYDYARQTYERYEKSAVDGAISKQDLDTKYNNFKTSEMNYQSAKADAEKAKEDYNRLLALQSYKEVTAPFDGVISKYNVDAGANVVSGGSSTSTCLFEIQQIDKFRASVFVPQNYVSYIHEGQSVEVYAPENPKHKIKGEISQISGKLDNVSRTMEAVLIIPNDGNSGLYSGLYVKMDIDIKNEEKIMTINPASIIIKTTPDEYVAEVRPNSTVHFIKVKQGRDFGDKIEILEGLNGNEKLITNPTDDLQEGQKVKWSVGDSNP